MARRDRKEMYQNFFDGVSATTIEFPLLDEELAQAEELIEANGWDRDEGLHIIFSHGMQYLTADARLRDVARDGDGLSDEVARLTRELMDSQSKYAVMKFRAYTLDQAKQALEMNVTGLETENRASGSRIWKFRADEEQLKGQLQQLKAEAERLRREVAILRGEAEPEPDRRGVLRRVVDAVWGRPAR